MSTRGDINCLAALIDRVQSGKVLKYISYPSSVKGVTITYGEYYGSPQWEKYRGLYISLQSILALMGRTVPDNKMCFLVQDAKGEQFWVGIKDWVVSVGNSAYGWDNQPIKDVV